MSRPRRERKDKARGSKALKRKQQQTRRAVDKQYVNGECVWNALLRGVADLEGVGCVTHCHLLRILKSKVSSLIDGKVALFEKMSVKWNGALLGKNEYIEVREAVSKTTVNTRGYDCRACDPLLVTVAAVFRVKIVHDMIGTEMVYSTRAPRRIIYITSTHGHMFHKRNVDIETTSTKEEHACEREDASMHQEKAFIRGDATCNICGALFPSINNMLRHQLKHRGFNN